MLALILLLAGCRPEPTCACPRCWTEPRDLLPEARLEVSGTRPAQGHPWTREDEAGPGALRNDLPDDGWQPPADEPAWLEVDLRPRLGRVALGSLEATWTGAVPEVEVALMAGCGLEPSAVFSWDVPSAPLDLTGLCGGCLRLGVERGDDTVLTGLTLVGAYEPHHDFQDDDTWIDVPPAPLDGSGVIEGFYGQPWSWRERRSALWGLSQAYMDLYLYAPKDDPYHRDRWREPYDDDTLAAFADLADLAGATGVDFVFGISPFLDYDSEDPDDYAALRDKLATMADLGVQGVALLADDIELEADVTVDGDLGALHVDVANQLRDDLHEEHPRLGFWFVPTVYGDDRLAEWDGAPAYLEALQALHASIPVMWTGTGTFAAALSAADLDTVRALIGRDPVLWDNLWANDIYDPFAGRVHLGLYSERDHDLAGVVSGFGANPMVQGSLSRLDVGLLAAWERRSDEGDGDPRYLAAGFETSDEEDQALLVRVMEAFDGTALALPGHPELEGADPVAEVDDLLPLLASLAALPSAVHQSGLDPELVDELVYPLDKVRHEARAGLFALTVAAERLAGREGAAAQAAAVEELDLSADSRFAWSPGAIDDLLDAALAQQLGDAALVPPVALPPSPSPCSMEGGLTWRPFGGASSVAVHGLPGASTEGDLILWVPPHPGTWTAVAIARSAAGGWAWVERAVGCEPG